MSKQTGLGDNFYYAGYDLSGDVGSLSRVGGGPSPLEVTGINKSALERLGGKRDGAIDFVAFFNDATGAAHPRLSSLPTTDQIATYARGTTLGSPAACLVSKQVNYDGNRAEDGSLTFTISTLANAYGLEWGRQLTAGKRTDTGATNGSSVDLGSASPGAFGLQAYLQVFSFSGTDATVKIQDATTSGGTYADVTGLTFSQITSNTPSAQRLATASNLVVREFVKVTTVTTGGFSSLAFAVMLVVNPVAVVF